MHVGRSCTVCISPDYLRSLAGMHKNIYKSIVYIFSLIGSVIIFFIVLTPVSIILKLLGIDYLVIKKPKNNDYWQNNHRKRFNLSFFKSQA